MKKAIIMILLIFMFLALSAQELSFRSFLNNRTFSFLNTNKLSMHHSFSFSSSFQSNGKANYISDYTNHLNYRINSKLNLKLNLHFINYGLANYKYNTSSLEFNNSKKINVLPEFILDYSPSDNFHIKIMYNQGINPYQSYQPFFR